MSSTTLTRSRPAAAVRSALTTDRPNVLLAVVLVAQLMIVLDLNVVTVALPHIQSALGFSATSLTWVMNAYTLTLGGLLLLGARAGDLLGRRRMFLIGLVVFTLASFLGGTATTSWWLLGGRVLQGVGAAMASPAVLALITATFAEGPARTRALGWFAGASIGGAALGLIAGGVLVQYLSWRWVMFVNVPIGLALLVAARIVVRETPRQQGRVDVLGALVSTAGMAGLVFGLVHAASDGWSGAVTLWSIGIGAGLLTAFVAIERRAAAPVVRLAIFAHRTRSVAYVARILLVAGALSNFYFLSLFFQDQLHYDALQAGLAFLPVTVVIFVMAQVSTRVLVPRFGAPKVVWVGMLLTAGSLLMLTQIDARSGYTIFLASFVVMGLGNGIAFAPLTALGLAGVTPELVGTGSGMVNVTQQVGASLGLAVLTSAFGTFSADNHGGGVLGAQLAFVDGVHGALITGAVLVAAAALMCAIGLAPARRVGAHRRERSMTDAAVQRSLEMAA